MSKTDLESPYSRKYRGTFLAGPHNFSIIALGERISVKILLFFSARIRGDPLDAIIYQYVPENNSYILLKSLSHNCVLATILFILVFNH